MLQLSELYGTVKPDSALYYAQQVKTNCENKLKGFGPDSPLFKKIRVQSGRAYALLSQNKNTTQKNCELYYNYAEKIFVSENAQTDLADLHYQRSLSLKYDGNFPASLDYIKKATAIRMKMHDTVQTAYLIMNSGFLYDNLGNLDQAQTVFFKALKIYESVKNKRGMAMCYNNIGLIYFEENDFAFAQNYYSKCLELCREIKFKRMESVVLNNLGNILLHSKDYVGGLKKLEESLKLKEELGDRKSAAFTLSNMSDVKRTQKDYKTAIEYGEKSLAVYEEIHNRADLYHPLMALSSAYSDKGDKAKAMQYAQRAFAIAKEINDVNAMALTSALKSSLLREKGNYKEALELSEFSTRMRDSLTNSEKHDASVKMRYQYEFEKRSATDSVHNLELQRRKDVEIRSQSKMLLQERITRYLLFAGLILIAVFSVIMINRFRFIKKQNRLIALQKAEVSEQHRQITDQKTEIMDSIAYASRIQSVMLPAEEDFYRQLPGSFIFFKPRDIVSGDFYWMERKDEDIFFTVGDCTGHGVPGGFMSMLSMSLLNETINENRLREPADILEMMRAKIIYSLKQKGESGENQDGIDMCLCRYNAVKNEIVFAGANRNLLLVRKGEEHYYQGVKRPVGICGGPVVAFEQQTVAVETNDMIFLFSDGFSDQFGGAKGKKFMQGHLVKFLASYAALPAEDQKNYLAKAFSDWMNFKRPDGTVREYAQVDDVCVVGVRI
ncbi:MAG: tetratricopeptide repeat protein [Bacteroidia bacterium]|nr:tetratricopeptide repeat protein [Bacteroidia bacterium]